ncbi:MAG: hypothetical protein ACP5E4_04670, partial [Candidatus Aenigmatarchaeota archaeon]
VYDGLAGCSEAVPVCGGSEDEVPTICESYLGGRCGSTYNHIPGYSKLLISAGVRFCQGSTTGSKCYVPSDWTCSNFPAGSYCPSTASKPYCGSEEWYVEVHKFSYGGLVDKNEKYAGCATEGCCVPKHDLNLPEPGEINPLELACGPRYSLEPDPHTSSGGTCYCNYLQINNFYECDDIWIDDSHPCESGNCAPDFVGGASHCCPQDYCSHYDDGLPLQTLAGRHDTGTTEEGTVMCFAPDSEITYEGLRLKCDKGLWKSSVGCGETIYNYALYSDTESGFISDDGSYKYGFKNTPISFNLDLPDGVKTEVLAQVTPADSSVEINFLKEYQVCEYPYSCYSCPTCYLTYEYQEVLSKKGDEEAILEDAVGKHLATFRGNTEGKIYNISVFCYTPEEEPCKPSKQQCGPDSYCSEDSIKNDGGERNCNPNTGNYLIGEYRCDDGTEDMWGRWSVLNSENCYYCCPTEHCAYRKSDTEVKCYEEGIHLIDGCRWICEDNLWGKGGVGNMDCDVDCDCNMPGENKYHCAQNLIEGESGICCNLKDCALEDSCVPEGRMVWQGGTLSSCENGEWSGAGYAVVSNYQNTVLSKS